MNELTPTFSGEIQLAGWTESHNSGAKVTFWLPDAESLDVFKVLTTKKGNTAGHRFMAVLVEIGDDEQPIQPVRKEPAIGHIGMWLVMRCQEPEFWRWLGSVGYDVKNESDAAVVLKQILRVSSRKEIDGNKDNETAFHQKVRGPYSKWLMARGIQ